MLMTLLVGLVAGFAAGKIMKGKGFGFIVNIILGLAGAWLGNYIFSHAEFSLGSSFWPQVIQALIGAILILAVVNLIGGKSR